MSYQFYLVEELTQPNPTALYSSTNNVEINSSNTIQINSATYYDIKNGMYVSINNGQQFIINDVVYSTTNQVYTLTISGEATIGLYNNAAWKVFNYTIVSNHIVLDTEDIEISTVFAVSDISDISTRKDSITKNIVLKGTDKNNQAFGHMFFLNKYVDLKLSNKLLFNYTPIRTVDCLVYEDGMLILKGSMLVTEVGVDKNGNLSYQVTITGKVTQLKTALGDKTLTDLNLNDMQHSYGVLPIIDSWGGNNTGPNAVGNSRTYWKNLVTNAVVLKPYQEGVGYIYPTIDYGEKFYAESANVDYTTFKIQNYRPGIWVREYFERIFKDSGFTYEIQGSPDFITKFNKIFVPDSGEGLTGIQKGIKGHISNSTAQIIILSNPFSFVGGNPVHYDDSESYVFPIKLSSVAASNYIDLDGQLFPNVQPFNGVTTPSAQRANNLIRIKKNFNSDGIVDVVGSFKQNSSSYNGQKYSVQIVRRTRLAPGTEDTPNDSGSWEVLGEQTFTSQYNVTQSFHASIALAPKDYTIDQQLQIRILLKENNTLIDCAVSSTFIKFAKDENTLSNVQIGVGDDITPRAPENVNQFDFIKSISNLFNLYIYNKKDNPKHLIFQNHDDFYGYATAQYIKTNAIDWTSKVDYSKGLKMKSNIAIPKKYLFTFKDDSDYLNQAYKEKYGESYGSFKFNDSYGFSDEKKVELIFSPTPSVKIAGTDKLLPYLVGGGTSLIDKKPTKTNIRLLYYNGVHACSGVTIGDDTLDTSTNVWHLDYVFAMSWYALASNYLFDSSSDNQHTPFIGGQPSPLVPISDLHYSYPKEFYFNADNGYFRIQDSYDYFINQTSELTNGNIFTIECSVYLNESDISNLDLRIPIFIDMGELGYSYFRVLNVEYTNNSQTSSVTLQKVVL